MRHAGCAITNILKSRERLYSKLYLFLFFSSVFIGVLRDINSKWTLHSIFIYEKLSRCRDKIMDCTWKIADTFVTSTIRGIHSGKLFILKTSPICVTIDLFKTERDIV